MGDWRYVLLCPDEAYPDLSGFIRDRNARARVTQAKNVPSLIEEVRAADGDVRVIAFLTDIIVPASVLSALKLTPYNIHPGPPEFRGSHANSFAIWEGAREFGVTAHEISPGIDEGHIVWVRRFPISPTPERMALADEAFTVAVEAYAHIAGHCAVSSDDLPHTTEKWGPRITRRRDFQDLCGRTARDDVEADVLTRACGSDRNLARLAG